MQSCVAASKHPSDERAFGWLLLWLLEARYGAVHAQDVRVAAETGLGRNAYLVKQRHSEQGPNSADAGAPWVNVDGVFGAVWVEAFSTSSRVACVVARDSSTW